MATEGVIQPGIVHDGNYRIGWVDQIADMSAPTVTELEAGHLLQCQVTPDGLSREASDEGVDTSRLCSVFTTMQVGRTSFELALTLVRLQEDQNTTDWPYHTLKKGKLGYLVIRDNQDGDNPWSSGNSTNGVPPDEVEVYKIQCGTRSKATPAANELQTYTLPFFMVKEPELYAEVAA